MPTHTSLLTHLPPGPTAAGYFLQGPSDISRSENGRLTRQAVQGGAKFAGYEFWKAKLVDWSGGYDKAVPKRTAIYLAGSSIAELIADILLTPCEATRIRLVSQKGYASGFLPAFARMAREGGLRELYAG